MTTGSNNPIEYLIAFGFTFFAGALTTLAIQQYGKYARRDQEAKA